MDITSIIKDFVSHKSSLLDGINILENSSEKINIIITEIKSHKHNYISYKGIKSVINKKSPLQQFIFVDISHDLEVSEKLATEFFRKVKNKSKFIFFTSSHLQNKTDSFYLFLNCLRIISI